MTSVTSTSVFTNASTQTSSTPDSAQSAATGQFETFLKMLTTQIKNQDPLNPMEGTEFAVQLATFSGVEQQVQTNLLLKQMATGSSGGELGQLSDWIGREVRTDAPVWFDQSPITLQIDSVADADSVELITLDATGNEVLRENIGLGSGEVDWLGKRENGDTLPASLYSFRIEASKNGEKIASGAVEAFTRVTGVELTNSGAQLVLQGGASASVDEISALRE